MIVETWYVSTLHNYIYSDFYIGGVLLGLRNGSCSCVSQLEPRILGNSVTFIPHVYVYY